MAISRDELKRAVDLALSGHWDMAHTIAQQDEADPTACWLHACLHKIEGDAGNARFWYRRSGGHAFDEFAGHAAEFAAIKQSLG